MRVSYKWGVRESSPLCSSRVEIPNLLPYRTLASPCYDSGNPDLVEQVIRRSLVLLGGAILPGLLEASLHPVEGSDAAGCTVSRRWAYT